MTNVQLQLIWNFRKIKRMENKTKTRAAASDFWEDPEEQFVIFWVS